MWRRRAALFLTERRADVVAAAETFEAAKQRRVVEGQRDLFGQEVSQRFMPANQEMLSEEVLAAGQAGAPASRQESPDSQSQDE